MWYLDAVASPRAHFSLVGSPVKVRLPDVEFYINVGDWPLETRKVDAVPVLSWCGSVDTRDIVLPTYEVTHSTLETMRGVTNDLLSVQGNTGSALGPHELPKPPRSNSALTNYRIPLKIFCPSHRIAVRLIIIFRGPRTVPVSFRVTLAPNPPGPPWTNKTDRAFFRGRDSREERLHLVSLSKASPELLDAGITGWFFFRDREKQVGKAPLVGFFDFFKVTWLIGLISSVKWNIVMLIMYFLSCSTSTR